jgi:hypothetical protein
MAHDQKSKPGTIHSAQPASLTNSDSALENVRSYRSSRTHRSTPNVTFLTSLPERPASPARARRRTPGPARWVEARE